MSTEPDWHSDASAIRHFRRRPDAATDLFEGPRLKIARAKKHILDFKAQLDAFNQLDPIRIYPETDAETGYLRTRMELAQPLPGELRTTAADALYNLRSALDQAVCRCAVAARKSPKGTYFPHGADLAGFEISLRTKCEKVPEAVRHAIAALEPYHGGNGYLLRVLHDLNVVDKHTDLIGVGMSVHRAELWRQKGLIPAGEVWRRTEDKFERITAAEVGSDDVHHQVKITLAIAFLDVQPIENEAATKVLAQLFDLVVQTVDIIEGALKHPSS